MQAFAEGLSAPAPDHVGSTLTLALFLDHMYQTRPAKRVEASPWYEAATAMVQDQLNNLLADAPKVMLSTLYQSQGVTLCRPTRVFVISFFCLGMRQPQQWCRSSSATCSLLHARYSCSESQ